MSRFRHAAIMSMMGQKSYRRRQCLWNKRISPSFQETHFKGIQKIMLLYESKHSQDPSCDERRIITICMVNTKQMNGKNSLRSVY